ncbi:acyl-CoA carboxylase subunit beta [Glaciecola petra]|uniref:Carboxyl transferase domain-containing protein n=1 Tax=Glaciecola petra TaxID=3075602 RepID=A0ABU2ZXP5_9ALTE|nr:carboxyl transferase domain-containing protein [Aestuariibacter sp. P117]MDT0596344.1 carboxyl transferase domain-containing protein [Aestuariibacter sp. P117]
MNKNLHPKNAPSNEPSTPHKTNQQAELELTERLNNTFDKNRPSQTKKRHAKGFNTARENLAKMCKTGRFIEYGQMAVAAQRQRKSYQDLQTETAADGVITGIGKVNESTINCTNESSKHSTALIINDYSVLAGTQGYFHHAKLDRIIEIAESQKLPVIMFTEGGGGRPGDTDITTVISGLQCTTFSRWAGLAGIVPRITINNGYCFAGNAALFGSGDITIATQSSNIGMAGPAMIEGGGLGKYTPSDIGPIDIQAANGVIDIVAQNENHAIEIAQFCLGFFQGDSKQWQAPKTKLIQEALPSDRRYTYSIYKVIEAIVDVSSFIEIGAHNGGAICNGFARINGCPIGIIANNSKVLGGAIDVAAAQKLTRFLTLCNQFSIPILSLVDTPGFMVGPAHEQLGAVRHLTSLFTVGATLTVPLVAIVLRKCYGLGAQAMLGGSTENPSYMVSWPTGEFGAMGLEGAVKLGFKTELESLVDADERQALFEKLLAQQYEKGKAIEVASVLELDAVIYAAETRKTIVAALGF